MIFHRSGSGGHPTSPLRYATEPKPGPPVEPDQLPSILVGIKLYPHRWDAVEWAAAEAVARRKRLRILHVMELTGTSAAGSDGFGLAHPTVPDADSQEQARSALCEAAQRARQVAPGLEVITQLELGNPAVVIAQSGRKAALIALGGGSTPILAANRNRSTSWRVVRRAKRPVALVDLAQRQVRGPLVGQVVVAVDPARDTRCALEIAFRAARQRGVGVAVAGPIAASQDWAGPSMPFPSNGRGGALAALKESFPDVDVTPFTFSFDNSYQTCSGLDGAAMLVIDTSTGWLRRSGFDGVSEWAVRAAGNSTVLLT